MLDDARFGVERDRRTDMPGYRIKAIADRELVRTRGLDDKMLFVVADKSRLGQVEQFHSRVRHL